MVHQYKLNGYNIVLDTCSGSIHSVDEVMEIEDRFTDEPTLMHIVMPDGSMKDVQMYRHYNRAVKTDCFSDEFDKMKQAFYDFGQKGKSPKE